MGQREAAKRAERERHAMIASGRLPGGRRVAAQGENASVPPPNNGQGAAGLHDGLHSVGAHD